MQWTPQSKMLTQVEEIRVQAGAGGLGGYGGDGLAGGSSSSSDEEDLDEELIRMGEEVLESLRESDSTFCNVL